MTYELNSIASILNTVYDSGSLVYANTVKSLVNQMNIYLEKQNFIDKLKIHKKRDVINGVINGFIAECLVIFNKESKL